MICKLTLSTIFPVSKGFIKFAVHRTAAISFSISTLAIRPGMPVWKKERKENEKIVCRKELFISAHDYKQPCQANVILPLKQCMILYISKNETIRQESKIMLA